MCLHLQEQRVNYCEHLVHAWGYSYQFAKGFWYSVIHGIFPFLYTKSATTLVRNMYGELIRK